MTTGANQASASDLLSDQVPGLTLGCRCGTVQVAVAVPGRAAGTRVTCYCRDCQAAAHHLGAQDCLLPAGGTDIYQTTPDHLRLLAGEAHLKIIRLGPKGLMRWVAGCCDSPLFNTVPRLGVPFVGVLLWGDVRAQADALLGPSQCQAYTAQAIRGPGAPARDAGFARAGAAVMTRMARSLLSGRGRVSPLRAADGGPIAPVQVLTLAQRKAATP